MKIVGTNIKRKEGVAKLTGQAKYIDDISLPNMLHGVTVRSSIPRGKITSIEFDPRINWSEFTVVTADDIDGKNYVALLETDQPFLAKDVINHREEAVVLLAHPVKHEAERARKYVHIKTDALPAVFDMEESLKKKYVVWRTDNVFKRINMTKGDVDQAFKAAARVIEAEYHTGAQEQLYIENQGVIASWSAQDGVTVWGSIQCPYYVHKAMKPLFNLTDEKVRIVQSETGGGFGGKEEYPSMLAGHAALLAKKSGRPVKMIYSRAEDMAATTKRHPSRTRIKTALDANGRILAHDIDFLIDGGAYCTLSPVVLSRGTIHANGPYLVENVRVMANAVATNHPPHGAFRGFGAPQSIFAMERHLDEIAHTLQECPVAFRKRHFLKAGEITATGQAIRETLDLPGLIDQALSKTDYFAKKKKYAEHNNRKTDRLRHGIGFASFMHGAGFTGSGEKHLASVAGIEADADGIITVLAGSTEIGQGTNTIFSQILAEALNIPYDWIRVAQPDTSRVPDSGPTVASRTCMIVGGLMHRAAGDLLAVLKTATGLTDAYSQDQFKDACKKYCAMQAGKSARVFVQYKLPSWINWDDQTYRGDAYAAYAWAVYVADVSVDVDTFETKVNHFYALQEAGKVIHPTLAAGQIEGGVAQGIGFAISEKIVWKDGTMINNQMTNYIMPTASDTPPIDVEFQELNFANGPFGAKGIGELPMDGPGPAILNAVRQATGISVTAIPMLPEDLMAASGGTLR
jgi:CO/xanthine dehydrogenase Mo-binding subunit